RGGLYRGSNRRSRWRSRFLAFIRATCNESKWRNQRECGGGQFHRAWKRQVFSCISVCLLSKADSVITRASLEAQVLDAKLPIYTSQQTSCALYPNNANFPSPLRNPQSLL